MAYDVPSIPASRPYRDPCHDHCGQKFHTITQMVRTTAQADS